ncbi:hypothetical protein ACKLTP_19170, partial [Paenarthrobacter ureafaciens]|uniref:hypothetical protein n=1 Tax=Paenarthrobacter ureafaciens TaxID=37931 RepID=UPI00397A92C0
LRTPWLPRGSGSIQASNANRLGLARYAEGPSWLGLTGYEEGTALVRRLLGPVFDYEQRMDAFAEHTPSGVQP